MKTLFCALIAAVAASTASASTWIEPLRARAGASCTADGIWCITAAKDNATVRHRDAGVVGTLALETNEDERIESAPWRSIVRMRTPGQSELVLVGVARTQREAYSGGGGFVTTLKLFELRAAAGAKADPVLDVPLESGFLVRACFTPADKRQRRGVCHDEYRYRAALAAAPGRGLVYKARADSFPGPRNRFGDDATSQGQLRKADLYRAVDRRCTFKRELAPNTATGALVWSAPPPACPEYLELQ